MNNATSKPSPSTGSATAQKGLEATAIASEKLHKAGQHFVTEPAKDIFGVLKSYAHDKPDVAAMWCFGLGLIVGWKLRG